MSTFSDPKKDVNAEKEQFNKLLEKEKQLLEQYNPIAHQIITLQRNPKSGESDRKIAKLKKELVDQDLENKLKQIREKIKTMGAVLKSNFNITSPSSRIPFNIDKESG